MADPRFTQEARQYIQDIQIYHADYKNKLAFNIQLHDGKSNAPLSLETHIFAKKLAKLRLPPEYEAQQFLMPMSGVKPMPSAQNNVIINSKADNHCLSRDQAKELGAVVLLSLSEATGMSYAELLDKVNVRGIEVDTLTRAELEPYVMALRSRNLN
jgi:hypothetical protein